MPFKLLPPRCAWGWLPSSCWYWLRRSSTCSPDSWCGRLFTKTAARKSDGSFRGTLFPALCRGCWYLHLSSQVRWYAWSSSESSSLSMHFCSDHPVSSCDSRKSASLRNLSRIPANFHLERQLSCSISSTRIPIQEGKDREEQVEVEKGQASQRGCAMDGMQMVVKWLKTWANVVWDDIKCERVRSTWTLNAPRNCRGQHRHWCRAWWAACCACRSNYCWCCNWSRT